MAWDWQLSFPRNRGGEKKEARDAHIAWERFNSPNMLKVGDRVRCSGPGIVLCCRTVWGTIKSLVQRGGRDIAVAKYIHQGSFCAGNGNL